MSSTSQNNQRIAKNTALLYVRMMLIMLVSLYTSRVVLNMLGVVDYGIYNVVGGVVSMLSFLNSSLNTATQRFLNYEMGKKNDEGTKKIFSMSFITYAIIAVVSVILSETIGLWFLYNKLIIPTDRLDAAFWVFQFSILTFVINLLMVPYNATIIAHERMSIYAYLSVAEVVLRLLLVFLLQIIELDKLWLYAFLMAIVSFVVFIAYRIFCLKLFPECRLRWIWDIKLLKKLFSFSGWMLTGNITNLLSTQGVNVLTNIFFGPVLNAARAISAQVNGAVQSFVANFMTAVRPQIVKSYAEGNVDYMNNLVYKSSRYSFFLLFILTTPILVNTNFILNLWLENVPEYTSLFTQLVLVDLLIASAYGPIAYVSQAFGRIKEYQLVISIGFLLVTVLTWIGFKIGGDAYWAFIILIIVDIFGYVARLIVLRKYLKFSIYQYYKKVIIPIASVFGIATALSFLPFLIIQQDSMFKNLFFLIWSIVVPTNCIWYIGITPSEKVFFIDKIKHLNKRN